MAEEQDLNSLAKFRKHPERLILEEHSHCEVPAGCGGVVLRWRHPDFAIPIRITVYTPVEGEVYLDGSRLTGSRNPLEAGSHVLAAHLGDVEYSSGVLMCSATLNEGTVASPTLELEKPEFEVLSQADGTWLFSIGEPNYDWYEPEFEADSWSPLAEHEPPDEQTLRSNSYSGRRCLLKGAKYLGLPEALATGSGPIWIRKTFEVVPPSPTRTS